MDAFRCMIHSKAHGRDEQRCCGGLETVKPIDVSLSESPDPIGRESDELMLLLFLYCRWCCFFLLRSKVYVCPCGDTATDTAGVDSTPRVAHIRFCSRVCVTVLRFLAVGC